MGLLVFRETPPSPRQIVRHPRHLALSATLFGLVWGLIKGSAYGWGSGRTMAFFVGAAVAAALFILRERHARQPLLPLRLFRSVALSAGSFWSHC